MMFFAVVRAACVTGDAKSGERSVVRRLTASLREDLVFQVASGGACMRIVVDGSVDYVRALAEAGVRVAQQRKGRMWKRVAVVAPVGRIRNLPDLRAKLVQGENTRVRQARRSAQRRSADIRALELLLPHHTTCKPVESTGEYKRLPSLPSRFQELAQPPRSAL